MTDKRSEEEDIRTVSAWLEEFAATPMQAPPLPDPSCLWWKAQLLRRWDAERQATAPIDIGESVQVGVGLAGCAALLAWFWRELPDVAAAPPVGLIVLTGLLLITVAALAILETIVEGIRDAPDGRPTA